MHARNYPLMGLFSLEFLAVYTYRFIYNLSLPESPKPVTWAAAVHCDAANSPVDRNIGLPLVQQMSSPDKFASYRYSSSFYSFYLLNGT
jgi:hypothetical protein